MNRFILINLKTYNNCCGKKALELARICEYFNDTYNFNIGIAPQYPDIYLLTLNTNIKIYAQHIDNIYSNNNTGKVSINCIKESGVYGSILNHSEYQLPIKNIYETINELKNNNLESIVCSSNINISKSLITLEPTYIAIEPTNLIGSNKSISKYYPEFIINIKKYIDKNKLDTKLLCGAGISSKEDIELAFNYGVDGILIASAIINSENKFKKLEELLL